MTNDLRKAAAILRQLATDRREFALPMGNPGDAGGVAHQAALLNHERCVMVSVADALEGDLPWYEIVGSYAQPWHWGGFGEHDPSLRFPWDERSPVDAGSLHPVELLERLADARGDDAETLRRFADARPEGRDRLLRGSELVLCEAALMRSVADALAGRTQWSDLQAAYAPTADWTDAGGVLNTTWNEAGRGDASPAAGDESTTVKRTRRSLERLDAFSARTEPSPPTL